MIVRGSEFEDNFDDNNYTGWTLGDGTLAAQNQQLEVTVALGGADYIYRAGTARAEYWAFFRMLFLPGYTWAASEYMQGSGIGSTAAARLLVGLERNALGTADWRVSHQNDSGLQVVSTAVAAVVGVWHEVLLHWKAATGAGANNGVVQVWIDNVLITNLSNVDSDTLTANSMILGNLTASAGVSMGLYLDDAALGFNYNMLVNGPDLNRSASSWVVTGTSSANTAQTITKAAETDRTHYLLGYEVACRGATPGASVTIQVYAGDVLIWSDAVNLNTPPWAKHTFEVGLKGIPSKALSVVVAAGGTSVITEANMEGATI